MYCPQCGQQQVSSNARFCSRCGFSLTFVMELLANNGVPAPRETEAQENKIPSRQTRRRIWAKLIFFSIVLVPLFIPLSIAIDSPAPLVIPLLMFFLGLTGEIYSRIFREDVRHTKEKAHYFPESSSARNAALPPPRGVPVTDYGSSRVKTAEMAQPPSVAENTTKLLDEK